VLDKTLAAGAGRSLLGSTECSLDRKGKFFESVDADSGLNNVSVGVLLGLCVPSEAGGGAAGNRNSGMVFGDARGDLRDPPALGGFTPPPRALGIRLNLSGG
jgi:hypothetical protein